MRHALIYYTHLATPGVATELRKLERGLAPEFSLFAMGCCSDRSALDALASERTVSRAYIRDDLRALPYNRQLKNVNWETLRKNPDLAVMRFFRGNPNFDYYWIIEYDVRYTGDWNLLFEDLNSSSEDLLCTHVASYQQSPDWSHWSSFSAGDETIDKARLVRAFLPFSRLSKRLMQAIDERCRRGWSGHPEVLWPTVAKATGLSIGEIGGLGSLVPDERKGKYYDSAIARSGIFFSTFGAWPFFSAKSAFDVTSPPDLLWHPVKE